MRDGRSGLGADLAAIGGLALAALAYTLLVVWPRAQVIDGSPHFDTYGYVYPNLRYALDSLASGHGLLWNRLQNCGQPFFAISLSGLLYPPYALALALDPHTLLFVLFALHLVVAGIGLYALARGLGAVPVAALLGAVVFELGATTVWNGLWAPTILAACAWMPVALAAVEWRMRGPRRAATAVLIAALALQWLIGYPQVSLFTYQVIGLRLLWEAASRGRAAPWRAMGVIVAAGAAAPLLCAVQLIPAAEVARESIRARPLALHELRPPTLTLTWEQLRQFAGDRYSYGALFPLGGVLMMALAWLAPAHRRLAFFYTAVALLYGALAFDNPVFDLYRALPLVGAFREPHRFLWVTAWTGSVVIALGADAALRDGDATRWRAGSTTLALILAGAALWWLAAGGFAADRVVLAAAAAAVLLVALAAPPGWRAAAGAALLVLLIAELVDDNRRQVFTLLTDDTRLMAHAPAFDAVRDRLTRQDRFYSVAGEEAARWGGLDEGLMKKAGQLFRLPSITDYEPQTSERYARYLVRMLYGRPLASVNEFAYELRWKPRSRALFDRTAARFIVIDAERAAALGWPTEDEYPLLWNAGNQRVFENPRALPRARYVPLVEAVGDGDEVLRRIAFGLHDARLLALLEGTPSPPRGSPGATGAARIAADESERVVVEVDASAPGFLFLADQLYPGWSALVNGRPAVIERADFVFRLVEVPAGHSTVEFRYRPRSLLIGAAVSAVTAVLLGIASVVGGRRRAGAVSSGTGTHTGTGTAGNGSI